MENMDPQSGTQAQNLARTVDGDHALRPLGPGLRRRSDDTVTLEEYDSDQYFDMSSGSHSAMRGYDNDDDEADEQDLCGFGGFNLCLVCKVDMGDCNSRQYCGKTHCATMTEETDDEENERQVVIDVRTRITTRNGSVSLGLTTVESTALKARRF